MPLVSGSAALSASSALTVSGNSTIDLGALWTVYQQLTATADRLTMYWESIMRAGGFAASSGTAYSAAYQAQVAAGNAYVTWVNAYHRLYPSPHGDAPLPTS